MTLSHWLGEMFHSLWSPVATHLWQATLFGLLVGTAAWLLNQASGRTRYTLWLLAAAKFAIPSMLISTLVAQLPLEAVTSWFHTVQTVQSTPVVALMTRPVAAFDETVIIRAGMKETTDWLTGIFFGVWAVGCGAFFLRWWLQHRKLARIIREAQTRTSGREYDALEQALLHIRIFQTADFAMQSPSDLRTPNWLRRPIRLVTSPEITEPGVWGVWRPVIALPAELAVHLSDTELKIVLMHELVHMLRWDNLLAQVHYLLCCILWFHPLVWLVDRRLLTEREQACDETVIEMTGNSTDYATGILKVFRFCLDWKAVAGVSYATGSSLHRRIEHIMHTSPTSKRTLLHRLAVGTLAVLFCGLLFSTGTFGSAALIGLDPQKSKRRPPAPPAVPDAPLPPAPPAAPGEPAPPDMAMTAPTPPVPPSAAEMAAPPAPPSAAGVPAPPAAPSALTPPPGAPAAPLAPQEPSKTFVPMTFENSAGTPIAITHLQTWVTTTTTDGNDVVEGKCTITNGTNRPIAGIATYSFIKGKTEVPFAFSFDFSETPSIPFGVVIMVKGKAEGYKLKVTGVQFKDGPTWGMPLRTSHPAEKRAEGKPLLIKRAEAVYPPLAKAARASGEVILEVTVDENGQVVEARVISGHPLLQQAALSAAKESEFEPARIQGSSVRASARMTYRFDLNDKDKHEMRDYIRRSEGVIRGSALNRAVPQYPEQAKTEGVQGDVVLQITIDEAGTVIAAEVVEGPELLRDACVTAARQWTFKPTVVEAKPVKVQGRLTFRFVL
ncbi:MAG: M56 family metallopeptidase [Blastocatellia bacterium]|nr:M56 family metallopeptidase [Blastocatellia bacterium]